LTFFFQLSASSRDSHSFPTRRSSDLGHTFRLKTASCFHNCTPRFEIEFQTSGVEFIQETTGLTVVECSPAIPGRGIRQMQLFLGTRHRYIEKSSFFL